MEHGNLVRYLTVAAAALFLGARPAPERFDLDRNHTRIGFAVKHMMVTNVRGTFGSFTGHIMLDEADVTRSTAEVVIEAASVDTNVERRDNHLRSADFFDAERFPQITFAGRRVERTDEGLALIGDLTIRDVTREVRLPFELTGPVRFGGGRKRLGAEASLTITRQDFGLTYSRAVESVPVVGDEVRIELDIEAQTPRVQTTP